MTSTSDPLVGDVLDGRYEIVARLARGGMATVYRAKDRRLGRVVAIKVMHEGLGDDDDFARKFDREARAAARLCDSHVVGVFDQGEDRGRPYIVMEYVDGTTLRTLITREAPLEPIRALALIEPVVAALAAAHSAGIVHRDVKPENVLISAGGQIKVADFGLARALTNQSATATQGLLIGTVSYLPPELVNGENAGPYSDVYSVGVVLFEMLTGRKPFTGETPLQVAYAHVNNDMPPPSSLRNDGSIPIWLDDLVIACTRRDIAARPRDARDLLNRIRKARRALATGTTDQQALRAVMSPPVLAAQPRSAAVQWLANDRFPKAASASTANPVDFHEASDPRRRDRLVAAVPGPVLVAPRLAATDADVGGATAARSPRSPRTPVFPSLVQDSVHRRRRRIVLGLVALLLAVALGIFSWWSTAGRYTVVPALANSTETEAIQIATANDMTISFESLYSETVPKDRVISSNPPAGERVLKRSQVRAVVSLGPERYEVPKLAGITLAEAQAALTRQNLATGEVTQEFSPTVSEGVVMSASRKAGEMVKKATAVNLTVSKGPQPIPVTDFTGKSATDAITALQAAGLVPAVQDQFSKDIAQGTVMSQQPKSGTLKKGDTVALIVSQGPRMVTIPADGLLWKQVNSARELLESVGLQANIQYTTSEVLRIGIVTKVEPDAGTAVPEGTVVTLHVM